ncbi:MAG: VOC family protein [Chlamydiales bacterium]|nr:VOC family protein [Chlamydiales bacterium]
MYAKSMGLVWIVVRDLKKAIHFYTENVGLRLMNSNEEYGWAELQGSEGGARLGIAQMRGGKEKIKPGENAVLTFTVENIEKAKADALKKGVKAIDDIEEVVGHVKMQLFVDQDGNHFQLVEMLGDHEH